MPKRLLPLLCIGFAPVLAAEPIEVQAPREIGEFLAPHLPSAPLADAAAREQARLRLLKNLPQWLATEGYFSPRIDIAEHGAGLRLAIDPGPRTQVAAVAIEIAGDLGAERRRALIAGWGLPPGRPFRQAEWSAAKENLLAQLLAEDYAGARLADSRAEIDPESHRARLQAHYETGPRYRFGELKIEGLSRYRPELVARYNQSVRPGEPYREDRLAALQSALQATPYFSSVQIELEPGEADSAPGPGSSIAAPVRLLVHESAPHRLAFGAGASSNTGARVEANYRTADLFHRAWELNGGIRLEQKKQTAYADIFLPPELRRHRYSFGALVEHTDIQNLATERYALGAQRAQQRGAVEMRLSLNWLAERKRPSGAPESTDRALVADSAWSWRHLDSLVDPRRGLALQAQLGGATRAFLSDRDFLRLHGHAQHYLPLGRQNVLMLRGELGYTAARSRRGIPQDYLFRAGGTHSVRGYAYQSLGVKEGAAVVGGRYLATASAELTHWLNERWGIAGFVDAGNAVDAPGRFTAARGYGVGGRWKSPAGPIAVDLAYGESSRSVQLHFSLAIPL